MFILGLALSIPNSIKKRNDFINLKSEIMKAFYELKNIEWQQFWDVFLFRFLYGLSVSIYFSNQSLFIEEKFNISKVYVGYTISFLSAIGVLSAFLFKYTNNLKLINYINAAFALSLLGLNFVHNIYVFLILLIPFSVCSTFLRITTMELILLKSMQFGKMGSLSGVSNSIISLGRSISPLTIGLSNSVIGNENVAPFIAFVPSFIACILCKYIVRKDKIN